MSKKITYISLIIFILYGLSSKTAAQELQSAYFMKTSVFRQQMNPALADQSYFGILFGNTNVGTRGNIGLGDFVYKLQDNPDYDLTTFMNPEISANEFLGKLHKKNKINVNLNYNVFSIGFHKFNGSNIIEANVKSNTTLCLPYELFEFMKTTGEKENYSFKNLGAKSISYIEFSLGHSHKVGKNLKIGGKLKFLSGLAYSKLDVKRMNLTLTDDVWSIDGDAEFSAAILNSTFKYDENTDAATTDASRGKKVNGIDNVSFGTPGFGVAVDMGFVYKMPTIEGLTFSGALTDLGTIVWSKTNKASSKGTWEFDGFDNEIYTTGTDNGDNKLGDQFSALGDDLKKVFSVYDDGQKSESSSLPTTLSLAAEYQFSFYKKMSAGLLYTGRFYGLYSSYQTMLALNYRPINCIEASANVASTSTGTTVGGMFSFYTKGFNLFIGSDSFVLGKVSKEYIPLGNANANVNFGISFPL